MIKVEKDIVEEHIVQLEDDITRETDESNTTETLDDKPKPKGNINY